MKTYSQKPSDVSRRWVLFDASELPLGRLATEIAKHLTGKYKPTYTPHVDGGDYVIVTNAHKIAVTGKKLTDKKYYRHSGYPGGLKVRTLQEMLDKKPTDVIRKAVERMLPKNKLGRQQINRLKLYVTDTHEHNAQKPEKLGK